MKDTVTYDEAVRALANLEKEAPEAGKKMSAFERSTVLAVLFDADKTETMDDLLDIRTKGEYRRRRGR